MARTNPQEFAEKWARRTSGASEDYRRGIQRVQQAPGQKAAAARQLWQTRVQESANKWERKVAAVSLADWQNMAQNKGAANLATGVQAAQDKVQRAAQTLLQNVDNVRGQVQGMPKQTLEQRIQRSVAFQTGMHRAYNGGGGGR